MDSNNKPWAGLGRSEDHNVVAQNQKVVSSNPGAGYLMDIEKTGNKQKRGWGRPIFNGF